MRASVLPSRSGFEDRTRDNRPNAAIHCPSTGTVAALVWDRVVDFGSPSYEGLGRDGAGHVASVLGEPPFGRMSDFSRETARRDAFEEAVTDKLAERLRRRVLVDVAAIRRIAGRESERAVVGSIVAGGDL